ncbi:MAG: hypothetical protein QM749_11960 [Aquabacterium sp.]
MPYRLAKSAAHAKALLTSSVMRWLSEGGPQFGAAIAFYTMFALAPLLVVAIAVAGAVFGADAARGPDRRRDTGAGRPRGGAGHRGHDRVRMAASQWHIGQFARRGHAAHRCHGVFTELRLALECHGAGHAAPSRSAPSCVCG